MPPPTYLVSSACASHRPRRELRRGNLKHPSSRPQLKLDSQLDVSSGTGRAMSLLFPTGPMTHTGTTGSVHLAAVTNQRR
jgi:hypothetical protein